MALLENQSQDIEIQRENFLFNQNFIEIQQRNDLEKIQNLIDKDNELIELRKKHQNSKSCPIRKRRHQYQ